MEFKDIVFLAAALIIGLLLNAGTRGFLRRHLYGYSNLYEEDLRKPAKREKRGKGAKREGPADFDKQEARRGADDRKAGNYSHKQS
jgi:hypothetical protein